MSHRKKHLHLNCFSGAGGDMVLSALVDLGADRQAIERELCALKIGITRLEFHDVMRSGMRGIHLRITELQSESQPDHLDCNHPHISSIPHAHHHDRHSPARHTHARGARRHLRDMLKVVESSNAEHAVKERAKRILFLLAEAEGRIHNKPIEEIHFHEISGVDTIVDVLGSCLALDMLGVDSISASPVTVGQGMIHCEHGRFPVPAPATLEILSKISIPFKQGDTEGELLTPTGAALLGTLVNQFGSSPPMRPEQTGYGAGSNDFCDHPNLLQATLGYRE